MPSAQLGSNAGRISGPNRSHRVRDRTRVSTARAFVAAYGGERGREATAESLAFAWEHWDRISRMDNAPGYLFRVGQSRTDRGAPSSHLPSERKTIRWSSRLSSCPQITISPPANRRGARARLRMDDQRGRRTDGDEGHNCAEPPGARTRQASPSARRRQTHGRSRPSARASHRRRWSRSARDRRGGQLMAARPSRRTFHGQSGLWTHRVTVVVVVAAILVVFFLPLPHLSLFRRFVRQQGHRLPLPRTRSRPLER